MITKILYLITARLPMRKIPTADGDPYLERYYVGALCGWTFHLHRFVGSGADTALHNHPWKHGASLILAGAYDEERVVDLCPQIDSGAATSWHRRRWFNRVDANTFHRVCDPLPETWTLFAHGPRDMLADGSVKGWGFLRTAVLHGTRHVTTFETYDARPTPWWEFSPTGRTGNREALR